MCPGANIFQAFRCSIETAPKNFFPNFFIGAWVCAYDGLPLESGAHVLPNKVFFTVFDR